MSGKVSNLSTEERLQYFIKRLSEKDNTKRYISGFTNIDSRLTIQCLKCGSIYEIAGSVVRSKAKYIYCKTCFEKDLAKQKEIKEHDKAIQKMQEHRIRYCNKIIKSKQLEFNICRTCNKVYLGNNLYCSDKCRRKYHDRQKEIKRRLETINDIDYTITLQKLIKRDNNICYICNKECNLNDYTYRGNTFIAGNYYPSIEHVIPLSKGGTHTWDNIKLAHRICNTLKGTKILEK